jgi:flagella basal body P-ring formation protein FlgA
VAASDVAVNRVRIAGTAVSVVQAAVLTHAVRPGAILQTNDVRMARLREAALRGNAPLAASAAIGMSLKRERPPGQALTLADLSKPLLVTRNEAVHMRLEAGGLMLSAQGIALDDGGMGERVRVQNPSSRAVVMAEVAGDGEVRVQPGRAPVLAAAQ